MFPVLYLLLPYDDSLNASIVHVPILKHLILGSHFDFRINQRHTNITIPFYS